MLMLSLDDAVKVAKSLVAGGKDDDAIIRQEMAQKCRNDVWRQQVVSTVAEMMNKVISGINSTEICNQIVSDNLRKWCERTQCKLRIAMDYLPYQGKALSAAQQDLQPTCDQFATDMVSRKAVRDMVSAWVYDLMEKEDLNMALHDVDELPPAQPETAKRIVGKSKDGMTLWYQCNMCNEPVDAQDIFCCGCGRRLTDG